MDNIIKFFIKESYKEFYVRELAKKLKKSPTTISKYLKDYEKQGILQSEKKFNHLLFKANVDNRKFKQVKLNYNISLINASGLIEFLEDYYNYPEAIILFGSLAKSENIPRSDIDLLIISSKKERPSLIKFEKKLEHEIQLFVHSKEELKELKKKNKELFNNWINGIVIYGYFEVMR